MRMSSLPNFVIIGPPKCGTSSLYNWLASHPQACGALKKETFYLMDKDNPLCATPSFHEKGWDGYADCFPDNVKNFPLRLEATTHYLFQDTALEALSQLDDVHVCVVLRNPISRIWSSFSYTKNNLARISKSFSFDTFLDYVLSNQQIPENYIPNARSRYVLQRDLYYGQYATSLAPWLEKLGHERVHCVKFEDLQTRPRQTLKRLASIYDIDTDWFDELTLESRNETYNIRNATIHSLAIKTNSLLKSSYLKKILKSIYMPFQKSNPQQSGPSESAIVKLQEYYAPHNLLLEKLLSMEFSDWALTPNSNKQDHEVMLS